MNFLQRIVNNLSIRQKLIALGMATSTIATIITCGGFIIFNIAAERNDIVAEMRMVSSIFSEEWAEYIALDQKSQILKSLGALRSRKSLLQVCIYKNKQEEFFQFVRDKNRKRSCSDMPPTKNRYELREDKGGEYLVVSAPVIYKDHKIGYLTMVFNLDRVNARMQRGIFNSLVLFIFILCISYLLSRHLQKTISRPILHLADVSYAVRDGDYNVRAGHFSNDELGVLTQAYNSMLKEIQYAKEHLEEKVAERTQDLEKVMEVKSQFLSNMSHEIRTPIHGIMNYADFLVQDWNILDKDKKYEFVKKLYTNSGRLLSLINNLLDLSKLDAGKMEFYAHKENMVTLIEGIIEECEALYMQNKNIEIEFIYDKNMPNNAVFDPERIAQVVRNLLSNAIKFTSKGKIRLILESVKFKKDNGSRIQGIQLSLQDEGIGIPEDELEYIFDKFNQSAKTKTGAGGTGLGLAISKEIIKAHKGIIWAENNPNNIGSVFKFIIPVHQQRND
jgi:signal transduction histidine kinase